MATPSNSTAANGDAASLSHLVAAALVTAEHEPAGRSQAQALAPPAHAGSRSGPRTSPEALGHFFEDSLDLLCIAGFDGRFKLLNPAWEHVLGWRLDALSAQPFLALVHPDDHEATEAEFRKGLRGTPTISFENRYRCRDGSYRTLQWTARPRPECQEIYAIARDVTARRQLELANLKAHDAVLDRLGRRLHDSLGPSLAGVTALATALAARLHAAADPETAAATDLRDHLRDASQLARDLAHGLNPLTLDLAGLQAALEQLAANAEAIYQIDCQCHCRLAAPSLNQNTGRHLLRIAQEAVNNAVRHGAPSHLAITLEQRARRGRLHIQDDGTGLSGDPHESRGMGMHTMEFRARAIGASLHFAPASPDGLCVTCSFPLGAEEPPGSP